MFNYERITTQLYSRIIYFQYRRMLHAHSIKVRCMYIKIPDDHDVFIIYMLFACHLHVNTDVIRQGDALESKAIINW